MKKAIVLVSGGIDSCVATAIASQKYELALLHINYGQRTEKKELLSFNKIADFYKNAVMENFASRGARFGKPWAPLKPETIQRKIREGFLSLPLVRTGEMQRSFKYEIKTKSVSPGTTGRVTTGYLAITNPTSYFPYHQLGTYTIPQRVMLRVQKSDRDTILVSMREILKRKRKKLRRHK